MRHRYFDLTLYSTSSSTSERTESFIVSHFRWDSIKKFLYVAHAYSSTSTNFDMFSKALIIHAHLFEYILYAIFIGISYMFMDVFIKQYVRRLDTNKTLNPLLRGVSFGILMQTALWTLLHASDLADAIRFFLSSMNRYPSWSKCQKATNITCMSSQDVMLYCRTNKIVDLKSTSAHVNYMKLFSNSDRNSTSMRLFVIGTVWICNFFIATMRDTALLKLFKFSFLWGIFSTLFILIFLIFSTEYITQAFYELMDIKDFFHVNSFNLVTDPFGVGLIGVYDFGTMSPFTMVDNAILLFTIIFLFAAFVRSLIVRVLYLVMKNCVEFKMAETPHYLLFSILPLGTEFMEAHKIFMFYIYSYLSAALVACLAMFTATISQLLHSECRSVKNIYIVGLLCFFGFILSMPLTVLTSKKMMGVLYGLNTCTLCLGALKVVIVMWIYGVHKFFTDIHFWLGFKPTQFWKYTWMLLPVYISVYNVTGVCNIVCSLSLYLFPIHYEFVLVLIIGSIVFDKGIKDYFAIIREIYISLGCSKIINVIYLTDMGQQNAALSWIALTFLVVIIFQAKVIIKFILKNNIVGVLKSDSKYGPPDVEDRKRRRSFDEIVQSRLCKHECLVLDEKYECNHLPLIFRNKPDVPSSESSLTNIYEDFTKKKTSSVIDVTVLHMH